MRAGLWAAAVLLASASCGGGHGGTAYDEPALTPSPPASLASRFPIDGIVDFTGLATQTATIPFHSATTGAFVKDTTLTWAMTDGEGAEGDVYFAFEWTDDTFDHGYDRAGPIDYDGLVVLFDDDESGTFDLGEDARAVIAATPIGSLYVDQHKSTGGSDLCGDGFGRLRYDAAAQKYQAELLFSRFTDAQGEDAILRETTRYNVVLFDHAQPAVPAFHLAYLFPGNDDSSAWGTLGFRPSLLLPVEKLPHDLAGLIVFTCHDAAQQTDVYTYDPNSRRVTRLTDTPLYEDNVSLSPDRQWIAFHAAPTWDDFAGYEVWKMRVDGTGLVQLTSNSILDGHPAWSPDGSRIAYASFRDQHAGAMVASIVVMDASGVELADLTSVPDDDNDPEWLRDGRIVFKTNRFHPYPQVKIAVMDDDGSDVQALTFDSVSPGTSDHDPVGDSTFVLFERFTKGTDYSQDLEALFSSWNVVEARLDGTGERTIVADGWVNYLPVYDPSGRYVALLKIHGTTDLRLATRDGGEDLGRLVPNVSTMHYFDWK